jgi:hypothetical protein
MLISKWEYAICPARDNMLVEDETCRWEHAICPVRDNMLVEDETCRFTPRPKGTECDWSVLSTFRPSGTERGGGVSFLPTCCLTGQRTPLYYLFCITLNY